MPQNGDFLIGRMMIVARFWGTLILDKPSKRQKITQNQIFQPEVRWYRRGELQAKRALALGWLGVHES
jgi:hypothetical protein